jgi:cell division protein FtsB
MQHMDDGGALGASSGSVAPRRRRLESVQEARSARRSLASWVLSFLLAVLVVSSLIGDNGYLATLRARQEQRTLEAKLAAIRLENRRLQGEAARLRTDRSALEDAARRHLGFVRPGETLVIVRDARPSPPASR